MGTKTLRKQWKAYVKQLEQTNIKIPEMEDLRPFMGARGGVLKRQTRSKKQQEAFKQAAAGVKGILGNKYSAAAIQKAQKDAKFEQQRKTAGRNAATKDARKQHKKKPEAGKPLTKRARQIAREAEEKYSRMVDILDKGSRDMLSAKVRYEIYKVLDEENVSDEDIENMTGEMEGLIEAGDDLDGGAPAIDLPKLFKDSGLADALSTALFTMSYEDGKALVDSLDGVDGLWITNSGEKLMTEGLKALITERN